VLNATIDRYAYATLEPCSGDVVELIAADQQYATMFPSGASIPDPLLSEVPLLAATYRRVMMDFNGGHPLPLRLTTFCDAPIGSGLGSSSTLVVAMLRAFSEWLKLALDDYAIARLAWRIERVDCGFEGGRQDQYAAAFGGFNFMEFGADERVLVTTLRIRPEIINELEASLLLFSTGVSRESARIIADQSQNVRSGATTALEAMHGLRREALAMKECLLRGDFEGIVQSMRQGWLNKKWSAASVSNQRIDTVYEAACASGALAGKVSGAGGGGFMLFFVPPAQRMAVARALGEFHGIVSNCHFTDRGAQAWRVQ